MGRTEFWRGAGAPVPNTLVPAAGVLAVNDAGEIRQEFEVTLLGRPVGGRPAANDEASDVRWVPPEELDGLDIHPTMRRQIDDFRHGRIPHVD